MFTIQQRKYVFANGLVEMSKELLASYWTKDMYIKSLQ